MDLTRRHFLARVGAAGGASLMYEAMTGLGLLAAPAQAPFELTGRAPGVRVVILGGGLAGMTVAYELGKVGYDCRVLEARARPGGRVFTVRRGTVSEEEGSSQTAAFDDGLYFNAGPMRISHHHHTTLAYCRELQVATEVFVPDCESAYLYQTRGPLAGRRVRLREARADFDGYIAELLSKALSQVQLDQPLTAEDRDRLLAYLRGIGALDQQRQYRGSPRRGLDDQGRLSTPLALHDLVAGIPGFYVQTDWSSQPTMMQVAGGMDRLPAALAARLGNRVVYRAAVREIGQSEKGVWAIYADADGRPQRVDADYCVSTIPLPVLNGIQKDLSQPVQSAIAASTYDGAGKIGLQFKRRFWEQDDEIYGGRSWTDQEIGQIIYPSHGFTGNKGVLVGYYLDFARTMRDRPPAERQRLALEQGTRIHPQYATEFETAFSVTWPRVPWSRGSWRSESDAALQALAPLRQPDGRVHFAGDYMTDMSSWMHGAFESAREVATAIHKRALTRR
ncbi:MAG TPA: flavin monoamine oxidase family protein [Vicinamibacterales bacterium]|nr:flavin monoamine oxidase family protein [Vicinamibacterales bacterium]